MVVRYALNGTVDRSQAKEAVEGVFPRRLTKTAFMDTFVGGGLETSRFAEIIKNMKASSNNDVLYCSERYNAANTFDYYMTSAMCDTLITHNLMTSDEKTSFLNAWPKD